MLSLVAIVLLYQRVILLNRMPLPKPPAALQDRAQEALQTLGYDPAGASTELRVSVCLSTTRDTSKRRRRRRIDGTC